MSRTIGHWLSVISLVITTTLFPPNSGFAAVPFGVSGVTSYQISPDSKYLIYEQSPTGFNNYSIYSMSLPEQSVVKLNSLPSSASSIIKISLDCQQVVYMDRADGGLYTVPISGTISATQIAVSDVISFQLSSDSRHIAYRTRAGSIYSASIDGTIRVEIATGNGLPWGDSDSNHYLLISPDDTFIVYPKN